MLLASSGFAAAQDRAPPANTYVTPGAPSVPTDSPVMRNPMVNPSAAGMSKGRMGSPNAAKAEELGSGDQGSTAKSELTKTQAARSLRNFGYTGITHLHVNQNGHWQGQATHNGRRVGVELTNSGTATEDK